jgi:hypothetical protein
VKKKLIVVLILALSIMLMPTVSAEKAITCTVDIYFNGVDAWLGTVTFPDGKVCDVIWWIDTDPDFVGHKKSPVFPEGKVEKFSETWEIFDGADGYASGWDKGVFDADSWRFVMNGKVDTATGTLAYLAGGKVHASGVATLTDTFYGVGIIKFSGYAG